MSAPARLERSISLHLSRTEVFHIKSIISKSFTGTVPRLQGLGPTSANIRGQFTLPRTFPACPSLRSCLDLLEIRESVCGFERNRGHYCKTHHSGMIPSDTRRRKRHAPSSLTEEYAPRYSHQGMQDPRAQVMPHQGYGGYVSAAQEYPSYAADAKRQRTSLEIDSRGYHNKGDAQMDQRNYPQLSYGAYSHQSVQPPQNSYSNGPHSAPANVPEYSFRTSHNQSTSTSTSSPYGSPRSSMNQRSPIGSSSTYSQQAQRYNGQAAPSASLPPPQPVQMPISTESLSRANPVTSQYASSILPQHSTGSVTTSTGTPPLIRSAHQNSTYSFPSPTDYQSSSGMPPPAVGGRQALQPPPTYSLPPLQTPASVDAVPLTLQPPHASSARSHRAADQSPSSLIGPPLSFDSAAQQTPQASIALDRWGGLR